MPRSHRARTVVAALSVAALALTGALTACAPPATITHEPVPQVDAALPTDLQEQLQTAVEAAMAATGSTGAIVEVRAPWSGVWKKAFGTTSAGGPAVTTDLAFKAGPITRTMTCDVLYAMAHAGVVSVDDPLSRWLSGYPSAEGVTLGQLCDSTSGIGSYGGEVAERLYLTPQRAWSPRELVAYGISQGLAFDPGSKYKDSDTGYLLLGLALERAGHMSAGELFTQYVFDPIGMTDSALPLSSIGSSGVLTGHRSGDDEDGDIDCAAPADVTDVSLSTGFTAGGAVTTVDDLSDYIQAVAAGSRSFDSDERFSDALPVSAKSPTWYLAGGGALHAASLVGQAGAVPGYLTAAFGDSETGMSIVLVLNNSRATGTIARDLAWEIAALVSKAPPASGQSSPDAGGLPWEASTYADRIAKAAICPLP